MDERYNRITDALFLISLVEFKELHSIHWGIESSHRAIKQVCGIELFMVRTSEAIKTHFFSAIRAFTQLELMRTEELIENWYEVQRNLSLQVARDFILEHLEQKMGLITHSQIPVNAYVLFIPNFLFTYPIANSHIFLYLKSPNNNLGLGFVCGLLNVSSKNFASGFLYN
ncbi:MULTISPECIES: transposase [unclassified Nostoc]|uniref:transposase n=1 Tax=unclassified Nostoc TaxID=2593658 RepID=UPI0018EFAAE8|nr:MULTISPECIES: transposase [unclassified Nostoc]